MPRPVERTSPRQRFRVSVVTRTIVKPRVDVYTAYAKNKTEARAEVLRALRAHVIKYSEFEIDRRYKITYVRRTH